MKNFVLKNKDRFYFTFRVLFGLFLMLAAWARLSEMLNGNVAPGFDFNTLVMLFELIGGIFVVIGFKTRETALVGGVAMILVYLIDYTGSWLNPMLNGGLSTLLFLVAFLALASQGSGKFAVDKE